MKNIIIALTCLFGFATPLVFALESDQVRGEVVEVLPEQDEIRLRILEAGDDQVVSVGDVVSYSVPEDANIEFELDSQLYNFYADSDLADISEGDTLILDFESVDQVNMASNVRNEEPRDTAVRERLQRDAQVVDAGESMASNDSNERSSLPESASVLPLVAIAGVFFALLAGTLRRVRG